MTTILPKEPVMTDRKSVILSDAERRNIRRKLKGSVKVAQHALNPKTQLKRLVAKGTSEVKQVAGDVGELAKKNAPVISAISIGTLLFLGRGPISRLFSRLKNRNNAPEGDQDRTET